MSRYDAVVNAIFGLAVVFVLIATLVSWLWRRRRARQAEHWPSTEATIDSGSIEAVAHTKYGTVQLPVFAFSYHVDEEYFGGRFALRPYLTDPDADVTQRMVGRRLQIRYDPREANVWFIPDELIEGCKVEQELSPDLVNLKPRN